MIEDVPKWKIRRQSWERAGVKVMYEDDSPLGPMYHVQKNGQNVSGHGGGTADQMRTRAYQAADRESGLTKAKV